MDEGRAILRAAPISSPSIPPRSGVLRCLRNSRRSSVRRRWYWQSTRNALTTVVATAGKHSFGAGVSPSGHDAVLWAREGAALGAGEILLTSMDRDGTRSGFDIALTRAISSSVNVPVIASGGANLPADFLDVFVEGQADAALAASIFHDAVQGLGELKRFLASHDVSVRINQ